jgi:hypothetical protein
MKAGRGELTEVRPFTFVTNISGVNQFKMCEQRWFNSRVMNRIRPIEETDFLATGKVGHDAIQALHERMGEWNSDAALGIAHEHAQRLRADVEQRGHLMYEKEAEKRVWFADWLEMALPLYAEKYRGVPWQEVICVEESMWIELDRQDVIDACKFPLPNGYDRMVIIGRPDAIVDIRGKLWHCQRKFFSEQVDLIEFCKRGAFQKHEITYLKMIEQLSAQGEFDGRPVGHTLFDLLRKLKVPTHPNAIDPPAGCKKCKVNQCVLIAQQVPGGIVKHEDILVHHPKADADWINAHIKTAMEQIERWRERVSAKRDEWDHYVDRAFYRDECVITKKQRARVWNNIVYDVVQMAHAALNIHDVTPSEGWACNAYHRRCPYEGVCAGTEALDGPQFGDRQSDYVDIPEGVE